MIEKAKLKPSPFFLDYICIMRYILMIVITCFFYGCSITWTPTSEEHEPAQSQEITHSDFCGFPSYSQPPASMLKGGLFPKGEPISVWFHPSADPIKANYIRRLREVEADSRNSIVFNISDEIIPTKLYQIRIGYETDDQDDRELRSFSFVGPDSERNGYIMYNDTDSLIWIPPTATTGLNSISLYIQNTDTDYLPPWESHYLPLHELMHALGLCHLQEWNDCSLIEDDCREDYCGSCVGFEVPEREPSITLYTIDSSCVKIKRLANVQEFYLTEFDWGLLGKMYPAEAVIEPPTVNTDYYWIGMVENYLNAGFDQTKYNTEIHNGTSLGDTLKAHKVIRCLTHHSYISTSGGVRINYKPLPPEAVIEFIERFDGDWEETVLTFENDDLLYGTFHTRFKGFYEDEIPIPPPVEVECKDCMATNYGAKEECSYVACEPKYSTTYLPKKIAEVYQAINNGEPSYTINYKIVNHAVYPPTVSKPNFYAGETKKAMDWYSDYFKCKYNFDLVWQKSEENIDLIITCQGDPRNKYTMVASPGGVDGSCKATPMKVTVPANDLWKVDGVYNTRAYSFAMAMAHEIGHFLVGHSHDNTCSGNPLMRSVLTHEKSLANRKDYLIYQAIDGNIARLEYVQTCNDIASATTYCTNFIKEIID